MTSSLITALTDEEIERLHQYQLDNARNEGIEQGIKQGIEQGIEQGRILKSFEAVEALVAEGTFDAPKACEILGVDIKAYEEHIKSEDNNKAG